MAALVAAIYVFIISAGSFRRSVDPRDKREDDVKGTALVLTP
jgi:hypothetical protein